MRNLVLKTQWAQVSHLIGQRLGLDFSSGRKDDLQRGCMDAARECGFADLAEWADWMLSGPLDPSRLQTLASHLTVGETYFFREMQTWDALAGHILPGLIQARRSRGRRLRIWSAGCCTGEEPYSLAILLQRILPDWRAWDVTITATDVNPRFLDKAREGIFSEWSFRNEPAGIKERYFTRTGAGNWAINPEIKQMVSIDYLNLVEEPFPPKVIGTEALDLILCRNVLMYFQASQIPKVVRNFHRALDADGWLVVSPSEASKRLYPQFTSVNFPGAILFRKGGAEPPAASPHPAPASAVAPEEPFEATLTGVWTDEQGLARESGQRSVPGPLAAVTAPGASEPERFSEQARTLADHGALGEALTCCDRWIASSKLDPVAHYLRGMILAEQGVPLEARSCLQRSIYLHPDFVMAHLALGNLARSLGDAHDAARHFANTQHLLEGRPMDEPVPESAGLTVGRLVQFIASLASRQHTP
ncbi:MAG: CheR family methyltransferase [Holophaga sp.]|jgi:chemotaxis protein methyltransferase CheR